MKTAFVLFDSRLVSDNRAKAFETGSISKVFTSALLANFGGEMIGKDSL